LLQDHFEQRRDNALKLWGLLMLELWFRMYIDRSWDSDVALSRQLDSRQLAGAAASSGRPAQRSISAWNSTLPLFYRSACSSRSSPRCFGALHAESMCWP